ncbi:MAG: DUF4214 domain-containing protein [Lachnospiraceae bacterium]|nr:DUF4214 domain-containing protein [Lachnospiraceae bacterium]
MRKLIPGIIIAVLFITGVYFYYRYAPDEWNLFSILGIKKESPVETETEKQTETETETDPYADIEDDTAEAFVYRLYTEVLGREPDREGFEKWTGTLKSGERTGAAVARAFILSNEFSGKEKMTDEEYIEMLYRALLGRSSDKNGMDIRLEQLSDGVSRQYPLKTMIDSREFQDMCRKAGIEPGTLDIVYERDKNIDVTRFINNTYKILLERSADEEGLENFAARMNGGTLSPAGLVYSIMHSREYAEHDNTAEEEVAMIYRCLLNREPDEKGMTGAMEKLGKGVSTDYIVRHVSGSEEYRNKTAYLGTDDSILKISQNRDQDIKVTEYVTMLYRNCLEREPDDGGLNDWTGRLLSGTMDGEELARAFLLSKEVTLKGPDKEEFARMTYRTMMGEEPDEGQLAGAVGILDRGGTKSDVIDMIASTLEFEERCTAYNITAHRVKYKVDPNKPMVALTFDDGPGYTVTPVILDVLEKNNARATFFVVGTSASRAPDLLQRAHDLGCEIGSHTWDHANLTTLDAAGIAEELEPAAQVISDAIGQRPPFMRPPYGAVNDTLRENAGVPMIYWSVDTMDWATKNADSTYNVVMNNVKDGDIILMHDSQISTGEAVKRIVPDLIEKGYQLVTVSELAYYKGYTMYPGEVYYSFR